MTSTELKALRESNIYTNNSRLITAEKLNLVIDEIINKLGGWVYYSNKTTAYQNIQGGVEAKLLNDGEGDETISSSKPSYLQNKLLQNNAILLSELPIGAIVHGRFSAKINTLFNNTEVKIVARFKDPSGQVISEYPFVDAEFKTQDEHTITETGIFFVGNGFVNGSIEFYATGNVNFQIVWSDLILDIR